MTDTNASPRAGSKRALIIAGSLIAALAVVYFSFFYPPVSTSDTEGTIGAVKKYRAEQITEKDVVLEGMASMNIEAVNQAVEQTGAKLAESAREAGKAAEGLLASARAPEAKAFSEAMTALASKAEALKAGVGDSRTPVYEAAAAVVDAAKENGLKYEALTAEARTPEALKAWDAAKMVGKLAEGLRDLSVRADFLRLSDAARMIAMKADGRNPEWNKLAEAAAALARQAEGLKPYSGKVELANFAEGATAFAKCANALRADASGNKFSAEAMHAALEASREMSGRGEMLSRAQAEQRTSLPE